MMRERATYKVSVDLDPIPGAFHDIAETAEQLEAILKSMIPHYNPKVEVEHHCNAQYGQNPDRCYLPPNHRQAHSNKWGTTWPVLKEATP